MITHRIVQGLDDLRTARDIRYHVFVREQQVPLVLEVDARDEKAVHVLLCADGQPIGTGRLLSDPHQDHICHLGRVALLRAWRGRGYGAALMRALAAEVDHVVPRGERPRVLALSAQCYAIGFYEKLGYRLTETPRYLDAGIWHRDLRKEID
ncbi:MAG: GNAT family N-acetyltransferase [Bowdeniella nasicola]|nr:GNAT family N-acetyltransferase [Bowdeniella nasicola]